MRKLFYRINAKLEQMYNARVWFTTILLAIVLDANDFSHQISLPTQLTSRELLDQIKYIGQREESLPQIVSGIYHHDAILQSLFE